MTFQSTPPRGGRPTHVMPHGNMRSLFQSTPPRGGRPVGRATSHHELRFQSTPPRGGRRAAAADGVAAYVSIHAPAWGATHVHRTGRDGHWFQSTPPRGGRRADRAKLPSIGDPVSIHAPAWGATSSTRASPLHSRYVSIHAPAWGATAARASTLMQTVRFNPRPRVGGDTATRAATNHVTFQSTPPRGGRPIAMTARTRLLRVSIHAPAWGATQLRATRRRDADAFQSTPPRGGRLSAANFLENKGREASYREAAMPGINYQQRAKAHSLYSIQPT